MILQKEINTRVATGIIAIALLFAVMGVQIAYARINNNDAVVSLSQQQDNVSTRLLLSAMTTATSTIGVDLSDTTNFKHSNSAGTIEVSQIRFEWDTLVPATTTVKIGVIASTSITGAVSDVYWFDEVGFVYNSQITDSTIKQTRVLNYAPGAMKLGVASGIPTGFLSNDSSISSSDSATTPTLRSPRGNFLSSPGVGDLVYRIAVQAGTATTSISTDYRVK